MAKYRGAVIGLGWMGLLYDLADRLWVRFEIDDVDRPTPELDIHRKFYHHDHPGTEGIPGSYSEAIWDRPGRRPGGGGRSGPEASRGVQGALRHRRALHGCRGDAPRRAAGHHRRVHQRQGPRRPDLPRRGVRRQGHRDRKAHVPHPRAGGPHGQHLRRGGGAAELRVHHDDAPVIRQGERADSGRRHRRRQVDRGAEAHRAAPELDLLSRRPSRVGGWDRRLAEASSTGTSTPTVRPGAATSSTGRG